MTDDPPDDLTFDIPEDRDADESVPRHDFTINGETFTMIMPKMMTTAGLLALIQDDTVNIRAAGRRYAQAFVGMLEYVLPVAPEPDEIPNPAHERDESLPAMIPNPDAGKLHGRARLAERLDNPRDTFDIEHLADICRGVVRAMFNRPTGPSPAS